MHKYKKNKTKTRPLVSAQVPWEKQGGLEVLRLMPSRTAMSLRGSAENVTEGSDTEQGARLRGQDAVFPYRHVGLQLPGRKAWSPDSAGTAPALCVCHELTFGPSRKARILYSDQ